MKKYKVVFHADAETDIHSSFEWGCRAWGSEKAKAWIVQLHGTIRDRLTTSPLSCPFAPESEELEVSVRHLIVGRYRILFIVEKSAVTVLHVRGPYAGEVPALSPAEVEAKKRHKTHK